MEARSTEVTEAKPWPAPTGQPELKPVTRKRLAPATQAFYLAFVLFAAVFAYWMLYRGLTFFRVPSESMVPALESGDYIATLPQDAYKRGDIVVLMDPLVKGGYLVKRVVAVGGDTVGVDLGYLSINGKYASEPYIREPMNYSLDTLTVPNSEVLVLGDNRNESDDASRWLINPATGEGVEAAKVGAKGDVVNGKRWKRTIPTVFVVGKVVFRYLPFHRIGKTPSYPLTNSAGE